MAERQCKEIFALLSEFLDGELPAKDCRTLERHIKDCKPCVAYLQTLRVTVESCRKYGALPVPKPTLHSPKSGNLRAAVAALVKSLQGKRPKLRVQHGSKVHRRNLKRTVRA
jgi:anti-sigma factor RsiW